MMAGHCGQRYGSELAAWIPAFAGMMRKACGGLGSPASGETLGGRAKPAPARSYKPEPELLSRPSTALLTRTFTATRRFCALPSGVVLSASGSAVAMPVGVSMR